MCGQASEHHDGWDQAYTGSLGDDIYTWMLGFSKP